MELDTARYRNCHFEYDGIFPIRAIVEIDPTSKSVLELWIPLRDLRDAIGTQTQIKAMTRTIDRKWGLGAYTAETRTLPLPTNAGKQRGVFCRVRAAYSILEKTRTNTEEAIALKETIESQVKSIGWKVPTFDRTMELAYA